MENELLTIAEVLDIAENNNEPTRAPNRGHKVKATRYDVIMGLLACVPEVAETSDDLDEYFNFVEAVKNIKAVKHKFIKNSDAKLPLADNQIISLH